MKRLLLLFLTIALLPLVVADPMTFDTYTLVTQEGTSGYATNGGKAIFILAYDHDNRNTTTPTSGGSSGKLPIASPTGETTLSTVDKAQDSLIRQDVLFLTITLTSVLSTLIILTIYARRRRARKKLEELYD